MAYIKFCMYLLSHAINFVESHVALMLYLFQFILRVTLFKCVNEIHEYFTSLCGKHMGLVIQCFHYGSSHSSGHIIEGSILNIFKSILLFT
jgi:hypothetical protein